MIFAPRNVAAILRKEIVTLLDQRDAKGQAEYGKPLTTWDGRDSGQDLEEEILDALQYCRKLRLEADDLRNENRAVWADCLKLREQIRELQGELEMMKGCARAVQGTLLLRRGANDGG